MEAESYGKKRERHWVGYKVHLTETCDEDKPHVITQVETVRLFNRITKRPPIFKMIWQKENFVLNNIWPMQAMSVRNSFWIAAKNMPLT